MAKAKWEISDFFLVHDIWSHSDSFMVDGLASQLIVLKDSPFPSGWGDPRTLLGRVASLSIFEVLGCFWGPRPWGLAPYVPNISFVIGFVNHFPQIL